MAIYSGFTVIFHSYLSLPEGKVHECDGDIAVIFDDIWGYIMDYNGIHRNMISE